MPTLSSRMEKGDLEFLKEYSSMNNLIYVIFCP